MNAGWRSLGVACALVACQQAKSTTGPTVPAAGLGEVGHERGDCRPDKTCEPNLLCLSNLCVRPPPADCAPIAEQLASFELGNYAEPEARAPVVAKYKTQCETSMVSKEEGTCMAQAHDKWAAAQCVPRMFPDLASTSDTGQCDAISQKISAALDKQTNYGNNPQMKGWLDTTIRVVKESCLQDHWPDALKHCVLATNMPQNPMAFQGCEKDMPPELTQKVQQRMTEAMQAWSAHQNGGG